jgi:hypothetical protein
MANSTYINAQFNPQIMSGFTFNPPDTGNLRIGFIDGAYNFRRFDTSGTTATASIISQPRTQIGGDAVNVTTIGNVSYDLGGNRNLLIAAASRGWVWWSNNGGNNWSGSRVVPTSTLTTTLIAVRRGDRMFYSLASGIQYTSTNGGLNWSTNLNIGTSKTIVSATITPNGTFIVGATDGNMYSSPDGINWTARGDKGTTVNDIIMFNNDSGVALINAPSSPQNIITNNIFQNNTNLNLPNNVITIPHGIFKTIIANFANSNNTINTVTSFGAFNYTTGNTYVTNRPNNMIHPYFASSNYRFRFHNPSLNGLTYVQQANIGVPPFTNIVKLQNNTYVAIVGTSTVLLLYYTRDGYNWFVVNTGNNLSIISGFSSRRNFDAIIT